MFAIAALTVGICGWIIWSRSRAPRTSSTSNGHPRVAEES
jgi:hypothetical protein